MMDEALIDEVAHHGVIYNRQKYHLSGSGAKYETKDEAWQIIAMKLRTDVETCKKRWKYLRERYVSQRKQGDPPVYEHLSRPYLEKMKFLDSHIQPRKSYRNVPSFLTSPTSANSSTYNEYNMDSKSNCSIKSGLNHFSSSSTSHHPYQDQSHPMNALSSAAAAASALESNNLVKIEADQVFRDFAAAVASQQLHHMSHSQMHHNNADPMEENCQSYSDHLRNTPMTELNNSTLNSSNESNANSINGNENVGNNNGLIPSSSSSLKSPLSSPLPGTNGGLHNGNASAGHNASNHPQQISHSSNNHIQNFNNGHHNDEMDSSGGNNMNMKKSRVQHNHSSNGPGSHYTDTDDDSDSTMVSNNVLHPQTILNEQQENILNNGGASSSSQTSLARNHSHNNGSQQPNVFGSNADFLFQLYQQLPHQQQGSSSGPTATTNAFNKFSNQQGHHPLLQRSSEHLLGELVTSELLKMTKDRRKHVQKRILEILFFDE